MSDQHDHDDQPPPSHDDSSQHPAWWPTTVNEAVNRLFAVLSAENQQRIRDEPNVLAWHLMLGRWIHNTFGLWGGNDALLRSCTEWRRGSDDPNMRPLLHPDDASAFILEALQVRPHHD